MCFYFLVLCAGSVGLSDMASDGTFMQVENDVSSGGPVNLTGWKVARKVEGSDDSIEYTFPADTVLGKGKSLKVWGKLAYRTNKEEGDLCGDCDNWGIGVNSVTRLFDEAGNERSYFDQNITFATL